MRLNYSLQIASLFVVALEDRILARFKNVQVLARRESHQIRLVKFLLLLARNIRIRLHLLQRFFIWPLHKLDLQPAVTIEHVLVLLARHSLSTQLEAETHIVHIRVRADHGTSTYARVLTICCRRRSNLTVEAEHV